MSLTPQQEKKLKRLAKITDKGEIGIVEELSELEEKLENEVKTAKNTAMEALKIASETSKQEGATGYKGEKGDRGEKGEKGDRGEKGATTIVEKVIEKIEVIKEQPIVTEVTKEVKIENPFILSGEEIVDRINELPDEEDKKIDAIHIEGLIKRLEELEKLAKQPRFNKVFGRMSSPEDGPSSGGGTWGSITGTLSDQTDLQTALDDRLKIDQTTQQTIINGTPIFNVGKTSNNTDKIKITPLTIAFPNQCSLDFDTTPSGESTFVVDEPVSYFFYAYKNTPLLYYSPVFTDSGIIEGNQKYVILTIVIPASADGVRVYRIRGFEDAESYGYLDFTANGNYNDYGDYRDVEIPWNATAPFFPTPNVQPQEYLPNALEIYNNTYSTSTPVFSVKPNTAGTVTVTNPNALNFTGAISASNLSGTNTGDQDLSGYALTSALSGYLPLTGGALTGPLSITGTVDVDAVESTIKASTINVAVTQPDAITGLKAWYKADALALNDGDAVASWTDSGPNGYHATEGTNRPLYKTNIIGTKPAIKFDGSNDKLKSTFTQATPYTLYVVGYWHTSPAGAQKGMLDGNTSLKGYLFTATANYMYFNNSLQIGPDNVNGVTTKHIWKQITNGASSSLTTDNLNTFTGTLAATSLDGFTFGARGNNTEFGAVYIAEVILYNGVLSANDQVKVGDYLGQKYGITMPTPSAVQTANLQEFKTAANVVVESTSPVGSKYIAGDLELDGVLNHDGSTAGFLGATPVTVQGATTDLGTVLSNFGLRTAGTAYPITTSGAVTLGSLTATRIPFAGTAGLLTDDADLTFVTDTLTATKIASTNFKASTGSTTLYDDNIYGSMYSDNADYTVVITASGVDTEVDGGFTVGTVNGMTFPDDHYIVASTAGKYLATYSMSLLTASVANKTIEGFMMIDGTRFAQGSSHSEVSPGGSNRPSTVSGTAILTLTANQQVSLGIRNHDDGTDVVVNHGSLTLMRIDN